MIVPHWRNAIASSFATSIRIRAASSIIVMALLSQGARLRVFGDPDAENIQGKSAPSALALPAIGTSSHVRPRHSSSWIFRPMVERMSGSGENGL